MAATLAEQPLADPAPSRRTRALLGSTAVTGLLLFVVSIGTWAPEGAPSAGEATAAQIRSFVDANALTIRLNTVAMLASVALFAFFIVGLAQLVHQSRKDSLVPGVMIICAAVAAVESLFLVAASSIFAFPHEIAELEDADVVNLYSLTAVAEWMQTLTLASACMTLIAAFSWAALRTRIIARWVAWTGLVITAVGAAEIADVILPGDAPNGAFLIVIFGWWLWPLAVGGALGVRWLRLPRPRNT